MSRLRRLGVPLKHFCAMIRIAADDIAISSVHCGKCLAKKGARVYPAPLVHASNECGAKVHVIDVLVEIVGAT